MTAAHKTTTEPLARLELDGEPVAAAELTALALTNHGHFTAAQVRSHRIRGLELHLRRLELATRELYGLSIDKDQIRDLAGRALRGLDRASLRITVFRATAGSLSTLISVREPVAAPARPQTLTAVEYERPLAHLKHVGTFAQVEYARRAELAGYDDALLVRDGWIRETTAANIGFHRDGEILWPDGPLLSGITMQLLDAQLRAAGIPVRRRPIHLGELEKAAGAFLVNSTGVAPVARIRDRELATDTEMLSHLEQLYEEVPWDEI